MSPQYWSSLQHTLAWTVFTGIENALNFVLLVAFFTVRSAVKGTWHRYLAATLIRGVGVPLIAAELFRVVVAIVSQDYVMTIPSMANAVIYAWWIRRYGDDDFWTDLKKKLKRKLKSLASGRRPAFAGTSA